MAHDESMTAMRVSVPNTFPVGLVCRRAARFGAIRMIAPALLAAVLCLSPAFASERIALVIGNGAYAHLPRLANPANDARLMAETLEGVGFQVERLLDADRDAMVQAIDRFGGRLQTGGADAVGLFFYAGHGLGANSANYLVPLGGPISNVAQLETGAVAARQVLQGMEQAGNALNIVILDACRNPLQAGTRSARAPSLVPGAGGFVQMGGPSGSLIAYSTALGMVAYDGEGRNSPYTEALAREIGAPGVRIEDVFRRVVAAVEQATRGRQTPWVSGSLRGNDYFYFRPPPASEAPLQLAQGSAGGQGGARIQGEAPNQSAAEPSLADGEDGWVLAEGRGDLGAGLAVATKQALLAASLQALASGSGSGVVRALDGGGLGRLVQPGTGRFIRRYEILDAGPTPARHAYQVRMRALVQDLNPEEEDGALEPFVTLMGSPKVLFILSEQDDRDGGAPVSAGEAVDLELEQGDIRLRLSRKPGAAGQSAALEGFPRISSAEQFMAQRFREAGYEVVTSDDVYRSGFVDDAEMLQARQGVGAFAARVGKAADADLVIAGNVRYEVSELDSGGTDLKGGKLGVVALAAKVIVPSSGKVLKMASRRERYLSVAAPSALIAREESLARAANAVADELKWQAPAMLAQEAREVSLELRGVAFGEAQAAKTFLAGLPGIDGVRMDGWRDQVSRYAIASRYAGPREYDLAGAMEGEFEEFEVVEIGHYRIVGSF